MNHDLITYAIIAVVALGGIAFVITPYLRKGDKAEAMFSADPDLIKSCKAVDTDYAEFGVVRPDSIDMMRAALRKAGAA